MSSFCRGVKLPWTAADRGRKTPSSPSWQVTWAICGKFLLYDGFQRRVPLLLQGLSLDGGPGLIVFQQVPGGEGLHLHQGTENGREHQQPAGQLPHPPHRPLGHQTVGQGAQDGGGGDPGEPGAQQLHHGEATAETADTMLNRRIRAQLPVIPRISPKAPPISSMRRLSPLPATVPVKTAAPL